MTRCIGFGLLGFCALLAATKVTVAKGIPTRKEVAPAFGTLPREKADQAAEEFLREHNQLIVDLIAQLDNQKTPPEGKVYAIYLLGELRAARAVRSLVEQIDFKAPFVDPKTKIGRWGMYPAVEALAKIGRSAIVEILGKLHTETDAGRRKLMVTVLWDADGAAVGRMQLQAEIEREADAKEKANLKDALDEFNKLLPLDKRIEG